MSQKYFGICHMHRKKYMLVLLIQGCNMSMYKILLNLSNKLLNIILPNINQCKSPIDLQAVVIKHNMP